MTSAATTTRRRTPPWWLWLVLSVVVLVGGVAALGGFSDVPIEDLPAAEVGEPHIGNEITTTITSITVADRKPGVEYESEGEQFVVVEATLENTTPEPNIFMRDLLRVIVGAAIEADTAVESVVDLRSGDQVDFLQPGVPVEVAFVWTVDAGAVAAGDDIVIGIFERYRAVDDPTFDDAYTAPVPVARIETVIGAGS